MIKRRVTRQVRVGSVKVGGAAPVSIQSMVKVATQDVKAVAAQVKRLETAGCEIVRVAVKDSKDAEAVAAIKRKIRLPLVADIHFDYRLALKCIANGADKIRINPGNMRKREDILAVIKGAKKAGIPVRIGLNSGSINVRGNREQVTGNRNIAARLVDTAMETVKLFEDNDFHDIIISLKASDVPTTVEAYRKISGLCDYPLHLGVTAAGPCDSGMVKSAIGIGALLLDGIGDTIRVSLTADPAEEVAAAKRILEGVGLRHFWPEIISCPTCGRCQVDLERIVRDLEGELSAIRYPLYAKRGITIAVMGCEVNGPGEAREADIGIAAGKGSGVLFVKGKIIKRLREKDFVEAILAELARNQ
jgi:(E)-4-hydroxy-3-methylbut-2-enyl-diphosphate synthase